MPCSVQVSACASGPCGAGGACVEESGGAGFRCVCARGFAPPYCAPAPHPAACPDIVCPPRSHCAYPPPPRPDTPSPAPIALMLMSDPQVYPT